jgi:hypothetical protein
MRSHYGLSAITPASGLFRPIPVTVESSKRARDGEGEEPKRHQDRPEEEKGRLLPRQGVHLPIGWRLRDPDQPEDEQDRAAHDENYGSGEREPQ